MIVEQLYTKCLSEAAYFIADNGEAAVIDPLRDVEEYLQKAKDHNVTIKYIFETHFHADFVSGHIELAERTGATIVYGPDTEAEFNFRKAEDGKEFKIGNITIKTLHTPGHTLESTCWLLKDEQQKPYCIFTGDTLFVGDVGRPDLFSGNLSKEELAAKLYHSLNTKIKTLSDEVIVYPAHGPGSACGKNLGSETFSTIGQQKENNYALQDQTEAEFIKAVTEGLTPPPAYFPLNAEMNKKGSSSMDEVKKRGLQPLSIPEFKEKVKAGAWILDTRDSSIFTEGFIKESISIGLDGRYAEWAGTLLPLEQELVLVTEIGKEEESLVRLARVGVDKISGYLQGSYEAWKAAGERTDMIIDVSPYELGIDMPHDNRLEVIDVRKPTEFDQSHVQGATNLPLNVMMDPMKLALVETDHNLYIHCAGGYRSVIASSLLKRQGFHNLRNVTGGFGKIQEEEGIPIVVGTQDLSSLN